MIDTFAPNTAAFDTPSVEGDAIALLRSVCIMRPDTDSPAPAISSARMRGMRMFRMMRSCAAVPRPNSAAKLSAMRMFDEPTSRHATQSAMSTAISTANATAVFFFAVAVSILCFMAKRKSARLFFGKDACPHDIRFTLFSGILRASARRLRLPADGV